MSATVTEIMKYGSFGSDVRNALKLTDADVKSLQKRLLE